MFLFFNFELVTKSLIFELVTPSEIVYFSSSS